MAAVQIHDVTPGRHGLAFDLREVLLALGPRARKASWTIGAASFRGEALLDVTGDGAAIVEELARSGERVSGAHLAKIARKVPVFPRK